MTDRWPEGSPQADALADPDEPYTAPGDWGSTPNDARAWWDKWFAAPYALSGIAPADLPGSMVLTSEEYAQAVEINQDFADAAREAAEAAVAEKPAAPKADRLAGYIATYEAIPLEKRTERQILALATNLQTYARQKA